MNTHLWSGTGLQALQALRYGIEIPLLPLGRIGLPASVAFGINYGFVDIVANIQPTVPLYQRVKTYGATVIGKY
jgi:hypothetical protein